VTPLQREALQMCLEYIETDAHERRHVRWKINEALAQPQQEPVQSKPDKNYISADNYGLSYEDTGVGFTDGDPNDGY
jgi:hypothetical protein